MDGFLVNRRSILVINYATAFVQSFIFLLRWWGYRPLILILFLVDLDDLFYDKELGMKRELRGQGQEGSSQMWLATPSPQPPSLKISPVLFKAVSPVSTTVPGRILRLCLHDICWMNVVLVKKVDDSCSAAGVGLLVGKTEAGLLFQVGSWSQSVTLPSVAFLLVLTSLSGCFHLLAFFVCILSWTEKPDLLLFLFVNPSWCLMTACLFYPHCSPREAERSVRHA